jgi:hypothetical protein
MSGKYYSDYQNKRVFNSGSKTRNYGEVGTSTRFHQYADEWLRNRIDEKLDQDKTSYLGGYQATEKSHNVAKGVLLFSFHHENQDTNFDAIGSLAGIKVKGEGISELKNREAVEAHIRLLGPSTINLDGPGFFGQTKQSEISYIGKGMIGYLHLNGEKPVQIGQRLRARCPDFDFAKNGRLVGGTGGYKTVPPDGELPLIVEPVDEGRVMKYIDLADINKYVRELDDTTKMLTYLGNVQKESGALVSFLQAAQLLIATGDVSIKAGIQGKIAELQPIVNNLYCHANHYAGDHLEFGFAACPGDPDEKISAIMTRQL